MPDLSRHAPLMLSILRIVSALMFMQHGLQKHFAFPAREGPGPEQFSQMWIGGWIELIGGVLLLLGLFTRPVAFVLSGMMAVAYFQFHAMSGGYHPIQNQGELAALYCFVFLYFVFAGPGSLSLDGSMRRRG